MNITGRKNAATVSMHKFVALINESKILPIFKYSKFQQVILHSCHDVRVFLNEYH